MLVITLLSATMIQGTNLVKNGDFEDNTTEDLTVGNGPWINNKINWEKAGDGAALASTEDVYEGIYSFFFKRDASDLQKNSITVWQDIAVEAGKAYDFSFMARLQDTDENVLRFGIKKMVGGEVKEVFLWKQDTLDVEEYTTWNKYEGRITIPNDADGVRLLLFRNPGGDSCFVDNVILTEHVPESNTGLVNNGDFEDNTTEDLTVGNGPWRTNKINWEKDGGGVVLASSEDVYEGIYSFFFKRDASEQQQNNITVWHDIPVEAGKVYDFSFMARLQNTEDNVFRFGIKKMVDGAPVDVWLWKQDTLDVAEYTDWNSYNGRIKMPDNADGVRLSFFRNPGGDSCFIDNVSMFLYEQESQNYYVSASAGDDANDGLTPETAWQTLEKVNASVFLPGDTIMFKRDDEFIGQLLVNYSGTAGSNIVYTDYGEGNKPRLNGSGAEGGDFTDVIYIENQEYIEISNLELTNNRKVPRPGTKDERSYGVHVRVNQPESKSHFRIRNLTIMDIYPVTVEGVDFQYVDAAGVYFYVTENYPDKEKHMRDIIVEDCLITRTCKFGVWIKHNGVSQDGVGNDTINKNMDIIIRNNHFLETGGSGITVSRAYNVLLENNLIRHSGFAERDERMIGRGSGLWFYACHNGISQYNKIYHPRGENDSYSQHIDFLNKDVIIQYNYSEDSEGGFAQILGNNVKSTYRFNVSVNDGFRESGNPKLKGSSIKISDFSEPKRVVSDSNFIYNNTIFVDNYINPSIWVDGSNTTIYNNLFQALDYCTIGRSTDIILRSGPTLSISNNLYNGYVSPYMKLWDTQKVTGDPEFTNPGASNAQGYMLMPSSAAIGKGKTFKEHPFPMARKGIFKDIPPYPTVDIFGNPIDLQNITPNIGAQAGNSATSIKSIAKLTLRVNPVSDVISLIVPDEHLTTKFHFQIVDISGVVLQELGEYEQWNKVITVQPNEGLFNGVYVLRVKSSAYEYGIPFMYRK